MSSTGLSLVSPGAELELLYRESLFQGEEDLVFCHPELGGVYDPSKLRKRFVAAAVRAGIRPVRFHDLRHTFGTQMAAAGAPLRAPTFDHGDVAVIERGSRQSERWRVDAGTSSEICSGGFRRASLVTRMVEAAQRAFPAVRQDGEPVGVVNPDSRCEARLLVASGSSMWSRSRCSSCRHACTADAPTSRSRT